MAGNFSFEDNVHRLQEQLQYIQESVRGFEAVMKLRCSLGFEAKEIIGRGRFDDETLELDVQSLSSQSTYCFTLKHDGNSLGDDEKVHFQLAVLYTSATTGQRLVRVHNLSTTVSTSVPLIFRHADLDTTMDTIIKLSVDRALK